MSASVRAAYPDGRAERDRWLLDRRGPRNPVDPARPVGAHLETEPNEEGTPEAVLSSAEAAWAFGVTIERVALPGGTDVVWRFAAPC